MEIHPDRDQEINEIRKAMGTSPDTNVELATPIFEGVKGIKVELYDACVNPYKAMFNMAVSTWSKHINKWPDVSPENRFKVIKALLEFKALPSAMEHPVFCFGIERCSRSAFDQIARARLGVCFSSQGWRDNDHSDIGFRIPQQIYDNQESREAVIDTFIHCKKVYHDMVTKGMANWQDARSTIPISACHMFSMSINYLALRNFCNKRLKFCVLPETLVPTITGVKQIKSIEKGDLVYSHDGKFHRVSEKIELDYNGDLYSFKISGFFNRDIKVTSEHKLLAVKRSKVDSLYNSKRWHKVVDLDKFDSNVEWVRADELEKGDFLAYPICEEEETVNDIDISEYWIEPNIVRKNSREHVPLTRIKLDYDFGRLVGYYIAEGHFSNGKGNSQIGFSFGKTEAEDRRKNEVIQLANKLGLQAINRGKSLTTSRIVVFSRQLGNWLSNIFGIGAVNKKLPGWIFKANKEFKKGMFTAWIEGDGISPGYGTTSSQVLVYQMKDIAMQLGFAVGINYRPVKGEQFIMGRKIKAPHNKFQLCGHIEDSKSNKGKRYWLSKKYGYYTIREVSKILISGKVSSMEIEGSSSYGILGLMGHNCEQADTVAVAWLMRKRVLETFPLLGSYLRPSCDARGVCEYHQSYSLSEAFGCLFQSCGRNVDKDSDGYATFNNACTDAKTLSEQLGIKIPGNREDLPPQCWEELKESDRELLCL